MLPARATRRRCTGRRCLQRRDKRSPAVSRQPSHTATDTRLSKWEERSVTRSVMKFTLRVMSDMSGCALSTVYGLRLTHPLPCSLLRLIHRFSFVRFKPQTKPIQQHRIQPTDLKISAHISNSFTIQRIFVGRLILPVDRFERAPQPIQ